MNDDPRTKARVDRACNDLEDAPNRMRECVALARLLKIRGYSGKHPVRGLIKANQLGLCVHSATGAWVERFHFGVDNVDASELNLLDELDAALVDAESAALPGREA